MPNTCKYKICDEDQKIAKPLLPIIRILTNTTAMSCLRANAAATEIVYKAPEKTAANADKNLQKPVTANHLEFYNKWQEPRVELTPETMHRFSTPFLLANSQLCIQKQAEELRLLEKKILSDIALSVNNSEGCRKVNQNLASDILLANEMERNLRLLQADSKDCHDEYYFKILGSRQPID